jgi:hypothetical protein
MSDPKQSSKKKKAEKNYGSKMRDLLKDRKTTKRVIAKKRAKR